MTHASILLEVLPSTAAVALCGAALAACGRKAETVGEWFKPWNRAKNMVTYIYIHKTVYAYRHIYIYTQIQRYQR